MQAFKWIQMPIMGNIAEWIRKYMREEAEGYKRTLEKLVGEISPEEAEIAHEATWKGLRFLILSILIEVALNITTYNLPRQYVEVSSFSYQMFWAFGLLSSLILVSLYKIRFGGRLMFMTMGLLAFYSPPVSSLRPDLYLNTLLLTLAETSLLGCLVDYGASTKPKRLHRRLRPLALLFPGAAIPASVIYDFSEIGRFPLITIISGLVCCAWGWFILPSVEKKVNLDHDPELLRIAAIGRYERFLAARIFAVAAGVLPFYLLLASFDIDQRLHWPKPNDSAIKISAAGHEKVWFWQQKARLLEVHDFKENLLYGFRLDLLSAEKWQEIRSGIRAVHMDDQDESAYSSLKTVLAPYSIDSSIKFNDLLSDDGSAPMLFSLESNSIQALGPFPGRKLFHVENLFDSSKPNLVDYTKREMQRTVSHNKTWRYLLAFYGALGFVLIWRRGADYSVARWLGIWLIGAGLVGAYKYSSLFLPAFYFQIWHRALTLPSGQFILALVLLIEAVTWTLVKMFVFFIPSAAVWTYVCWHQNTRSDRADRMAFWLLVFKIALVAAAMNVLFFTLLLMTKIVEQFKHGRSQIDIIGVLVIVSLFSIPCLLFGRLIQRKYDPGHLSPLDWMSATLFIGCQPIVLLAAAQETTLRGTILLEFLNISIGIMFMFILLALFLRRQFLYIINTQQLSFVIAVVLVPGILDFLEDRLRSLVAVYSQNALIYERGTEALSVVLAVLLFPKAKVYVEKILTFVTTHRLVRVERLIRETLGDLGDLRQPAALNRLQKAFLGCGIEEYALYSRRDDDEFEMVVRSSGYSSPSSIKVSKFLRHFLGMNLRFIDLRLMKWEWRFFFFQFELSGIQRLTNAGFLLPIVLSEGVRGLLIIPYDSKSRHTIGDLFAKEIVNLGLVGVQR